MSDPDAASLSQLIRGYWASQVVGTVAQLGIADHLAPFPLDCDALAEATGCEPRATCRLLRACCHVGLVRSLPDRRFGLTPLGELLRSNVPGSQRDTAVALTAPGHWLPWGHLTEAVRSGERQAATALGAELFDYYATHADEGSAFTGAMADRSALVGDEVAKVLDVSAVSHVVDVGGASGGIIAALLRRNATLRGAILDRADVVPRAEAALAELGLLSRCQVIAGDFFEDVPDADLYILKHILHDWDDDQSLTILRNCARGLRGNGRVVLVEWVMPDDEEPSPAALADLNMLVLLPGRERTLGEFAALLRTSGLRLDTVTELALSMHVIEASPVMPGAECADHDQATKRSEAGFAG